MKTLGAIPSVTGVFKLIHVSYLTARYRIMERISMWRKEKAFERAKKKADHLHKVTGKKLYVIEAGDGKYVILNSHDVLRNKKKGIFKKDTNFIQLQEISSYIVG